MAHGVFRNSGRFSQKRIALFLRPWYLRFWRDDYTLHINNIRLAVYLIEVFKGLNHQDQAQELIKKVDLYFQKNLSNIKRTVYFGLTDIQFFALNGQQAKAIQRLEQAILETKWLPKCILDVATIR